MTPCGRSPTRQVSRRARVALLDTTEVDDDMALVVETSGSTDAPKRVMLSADALIASADATADRLDGPGRWLLALTGHYVAGVLRCSCGRSSPAPRPCRSMTGRSRQRGSPRHPLDSVPRPALHLLVPVQLARILDRASATIRGRRRSAATTRCSSEGRRSLRNSSSGPTGSVRGSCAPTARARPRAAASTTVARSTRRRAPLVEGSWSSRTDARPRAISGPRSAPRDLHDRRPRHPLVSRTGDLGDLAPDGLLSIRGRADDVIISGGVKVALGEVERAIRGVPGFARPSWSRSTTPTGVSGPRSRRSRRVR
ncbi:hypothetical protein ACFFRL_19630 [Agromyces hippuratus]|uniref:hypothetical protein n=1 Tax=Agromyces hippuratus TaxID=286438 RepID=UPI0035E4869E